MRRNAQYYLVVTIMLLALSASASCAQSTSREDQQSGFLKQLKDPNVQDVNKSIVLELDWSDPSDLRSGGLVNFIIRNQSEHRLQFPTNANAQIFAFDQEKNEWIPVKNDIEYSGVDVVTVFPRGQGSEIALNSVVPVLESPGEETLIRIAVTGYIVKNNQVSTQPVSAYIDLTLQQ